MRAMLVVTTLLKYFAIKSAKIEKPQQVLFGYHPSRIVHSMFGIFRLPAGIFALVKRERLRAVELCLTSFAAHFETEIVWMVSRCADSDGV